MRDSFSDFERSHRIGRICRPSWASRGVVSMPCTIWLCTSSERRRSLCQRALCKLCYRSWTLQRAPESPARSYVHHFWKSSFAFGRHPKPTHLPTEAAWCRIRDRFIVREICLSTSRSSQPNKTATCISSSFARPLEADSSYSSPCGSDDEIIRKEPRSQSQLASRPSRTSPSHVAGSG